MAHGKSLDLKAITPPEPVVIHRNVGIPRSARRSRRLFGAWKGPLVENQSYVNGARDLRKKRTLRGDR